MYTPHMVQIQPHPVSTKGMQLLHPYHVTHHNIGNCAKQQRDAHENKKETQ